MTTIVLTDLIKGKQAHIDSIGSNPEFGAWDAIVSRRLADLGFSPGMPLLVIATGLMGKGPYAVRLGNQSQFSLRSGEAKKILCRIADG
ncbi:ferrous iron transport protein A [Neisseria weixii]|uniref:Ferrous iron transport protein A n=1 Tax=Neisseria weixii TaxID=1853276 RepID=A0A3N4NP22_9NEIS|nr:FeoA family protein [Neisseria weixii]RPD89003.1 ferrous iron transport protein A [Neisseria weixii]RPD89355.1 ferrous iron transport protein A [Neisseria weixii]